MVRAEGGHWAAQLERGADRTDRGRGPGKGIRREVPAGRRRPWLLAQAGTWEEARRPRREVVFPRLTTPRGRKDDVVGTQAAVGQLQGGGQKAGGTAGRLRRGGHGGPAGGGPGHAGPAGADGGFRQRPTGRKSCGATSPTSPTRSTWRCTLLVEPDGAPTELGEQVAARYREILVDEYQDTNEVQNAIFRAVSRRGKNLFTVGDVKQSIYRFRLADPTHLPGKVQPLPVLGGGGGGGGAEDPALPELPLPAGGPGRSQLHLLQHPL